MGRGGFLLKALATVSVSKKYFFEQLTVALKGNVKALI